MYSFYLLHMSIQENDSTVKHKLPHAVRSFKFSFSDYREDVVSCDQTRVTENLQLSLVF